MRFVGKQDKSGWTVVFVTVVSLPLIMVFLTAPARGQVKYEIENVVLGFPTQSYSPVAVNILKQVVGTYVTTSGKATLGFAYYGPGHPTLSLAAPGSVNFTRANGINLYGTIAGDFFGSDGVYHGYLYNGGYTTYNLPAFNEQRNKFSTSLFGISDLGNLAGAANPKGAIEGFAVIGGTLFEFYVGDKINTYALAINDAGTAVGEYFDIGSSNPRGYMWSSENGVTKLDYPNAVWTVCDGIDNNENITGSYGDTQGFQHGFVYTTSQGFFTTDLPATGISSRFLYHVGTYTAPGGAIVGYLAQEISPGGEGSITVLGAESTSVYGLNKNFDFVGEYTDSSGLNHGMLFTSDQDLITIDDGSAANNSTVCQGINAAQQIVCNYVDSSGNSQAALYVNGSYTQITYPGAASLSAYGIDDAGDLAGVFTDSSNNSHGFLLKGGIGGTPTQLDAPGATFTVASGINNKGEVITYWGDSTGYVESSLYEISSRTYTKYNLPGAAFSFASGIDDAGDIVYTWTDTEGNVHGGLSQVASSNQRSYSLMDDLRTGPGFSGTRAYGVLNTTSGVRIVGRYPMSGTGQTNEFASFIW